MDLGLQDLGLSSSLMEGLWADLYHLLLPNSPVWLLEPLEDIGMLVALAGLRGHTNLCFLLEECSHLSFSLNKN